MKQVIPPAVLHQHLGIFGKTGRGKTTTGKNCVEQVYDEEFRVCILDPIKSDWWGLTSSADGKRGGLPFYILGGPHAHLPLASSSGKAIADLVARGQLRHTIIDMAEFEPGGQLRWFVDFAPRLLQRIKGVLYLVMEEAHLFAPKERVGMGHENMSIHWAKMLATAGRTKGIRLIVLSQRTQSLHNAVIGSCDSMIVHGFTAPADMEPLIKWMKANTKDKELVSTIEGSLSGLKTGTGWLCSAEAGIFALREFPKARTYDNTVTPEDDSELATVKQSPVDLEALKDILGKAVIEAEANDPAHLRKRIAELEAQVRKAPTGPDPEVVSREIARARNEAIAARNDASSAADMARLEGHKTGAREGYLNALALVKGLVDGVFSPLTEQIWEARGNYVARLGALAADAPKAGIPQARVSEPPKRVRSEIPPQSFGMAHPKLEGVVDPESITGLRAKILAALRWLEDKGIRPAPRATVGAIAHCTTDKGFGARKLGELKTAGLITYPVPGTIELTDEGRTLAPVPPAFASVVDAWLDFVSGLHRDVIALLLKRHPNPVTREELGSALGKTFDKGYGARVLGELKTMGAIEYPVAGSLALTKYVMP